MVNDFALLARSPRAGVAALLPRASALLAFALMVLASLTSTFAAARVASETDVNALFFAGTREPLVQVLIDAFGPERTAVVLYLIQRSFDAVIFASAISPLFYWLLGSSAVHVSARLAGIRRPYLPLLLLFAYATAITLIPANLATLALGTGKGFGAALASVVGVVCLAWFLVIAFRAIEAHYGVDRDRATRILVVAIVFFYLLPLVLIIAAAVSIIIAAVVLEYF